MIFHRFLALETRLEKPKLQILEILNITCVSVFVEKNEVFTVVLEKIYVEKIEIAAIEDISRNGSEEYFQQPHSF